MHEVNNCGIEVFFDLTCMTLFYVRYICTRHILENVTELHVKVKITFIKQLSV